MPRAGGTSVNDPARSTVLYGAAPHGEDRSRRPREPSKESQVESSQREEVLQGLHDRHAPELWRFAMRLTRDPQVAEDVVQESLLRAWRDPQLATRSEQQSRAWLFTVVRNLVVDRWRSAASRHEVQV